MTRGTLQGPRGSAPATVRRFAPLSGLRSAPRALQCTPVLFFNCATHREKSPDISKKVKDISQFHAISQKNVAIYIKVLCKYGLCYYYVVLKVTQARYSIAKHHFSSVLECKIRLVLM